MKNVLFLFICITNLSTVALAEGLKINTTTHQYTMSAHGITISPDTISVLNPDGSVTLDDLYVLIRTRGYGEGQGSVFRVGSDIRDTHAVHEGICKLIQMKFHKPKDKTGFEYVDVTYERLADFNSDGTFLGIIDNDKKNTKLKSVTCKAI